MVNWDAIEEFRNHSLNPENPSMRGSHENGDIFFQHREACNRYYDRLPATVEKYMEKVNAKIGTNYQLFNYYGAPDAERVIICMGSFCDVAEEVVDYMTAHGEKVGLVKVRLYRPFVAEKLLAAIPATAKKIAVLDRTKGARQPGRAPVPGCGHRPARSGQRRRRDRRPLRPGLKDTPPRSVFAVYDELAKAEPKSRFTIGIVDDVTGLSLEEKPAPNTAAEGHQGVQVLGPWRRWHRGRQQEQHQDHRRPHRQVYPGVLPVRLEKKPAA